MDAHTTGTPIRVVTGGIPPLKGASVAEKMEDMRRNHDWLRTCIMQQPRGFLSLVGAILTEPCSPEADYGVFYIDAVSYTHLRLRVVGRQRLDGQAVRVGDHFGYGGGTHPALAGAHARAGLRLEPVGGVAPGFDGPAQLARGQLLAAAHHGVVGGQEGRRGGREKGFHERLHGVAAVQPEQLSLIHI